MQVSDTMRVHSIWELAGERHESMVRMRVRRTFGTRYAQELGRRQREVAKDLNGKLVDGYCLFRL